MTEKVITQGVVITEAPVSTEEGFPQKFVGFNAEYGFAALEDWLDKQNAPQEIKDLAEGLRGTLMILEDSENGYISGCYTEAVASNLIAIGRGIKFTGINVHTPDSLMQL
jgi:hypothetical protein